MCSQPINENHIQGHQPKPAINQPNGSVNMCGNNARDDSLMTTLVSEGFQIIIGDITLKKKNTQTPKINNKQRDFQAKHKSN